MGKGVVEADGDPRDGLYDTQSSADRRMGATDRVVGMKAIA